MQSNSINMIGGYLLRFAGTPVSGASGTYKGVALTGCLLIDVTNGVLYINDSNIKGTPNWTKVGLQDASFVGE